MIRARVHQSGAITVHESPNIIARLLGAELRDYEADYTGGWWSNADTGEPLSGKAVQAIERALTKRAVERRFEGLVGR